ncbi:MAG: DUF1611 domain-containing protein [Acidiferrobacterales bacterium]
MTGNKQELTIIHNDGNPSQRTPVTTLDPLRIRAAKAAYTTRRVPLDRIRTLVTGAVRPQPGDLVLARVAEIGQHTKLELVSGRRATLYIGDEVVVCYGNRYAPDQFEAVVPDSLKPCQLVAAGGVAARMLCKHTRLKPPTAIAPLGMLADTHGRRLNLRDYTVRKPLSTRARPFTVAVVGTAMNAGKTTSAAHLVRGLTRSGLRVGTAKVTGTGAGGDVWMMSDAGAYEAVDFTDAGYASTYCAGARQTQDILTTLASYLGSLEVETIVLEVADGLLQHETATLLRSPDFMAHVDGVVFAASDAMGAVAGVQWLQRHGVNVLAVSGALTSSPLAVREAEQGVDLPVLGRHELSDPGVAAQLVVQSSLWRRAAEAAG